MSKLFILGAGFSNTFGLPTTTTLFREFMQFLINNNELALAGKISGFLDYLCPVFKINENNYEAIDIEEFFSLIDVYIEYIEKLLEDKNVKGAYAKLRDEILINLRKFFQNKVDNIENKEILRKFIDKLIDKDTVIISFNWDNILEKYCSDKIDLDESNLGKKALLIKPHGSIDWLRDYSDNNTEHVKGFDVIYDKSLNYSISKIKDLNSDSIKDKPPFILYPTSYKDYNYFRFLMDEVSDKVKKADEIFFIGFSCRDNEHFVRLILRTAIFDIHLRKIRNNIRSIKIIDKSWETDLNLASRFKKYISDEIAFDFKGSTLVDYLSIN